MKKAILIPMLFCVVASIISCGDQADMTAAPKETSGTETTAVDTSDYGVAQRTYDDVDYNGYQVRFLTRGTGETSMWNELYHSEEIGDVLSDSIVKRNRQTEEILNVEIVPIWTDDGFEGALKNAQNAILANEDAYDFILSSMQFVLTPLARQQMLLNLYDIETITLTDPWWDENVVGNFTLFGDTLYQISGDFNFYDDYASAGLLLNKNLCLGIGYDIPYEAVRDGEWTIDMLGEMCRDFTQDLDGNGKINLEDKVGYLDNSGIVIHNYYASGWGLTALNEQGELYYIVESERYSNIVDRIKSVFRSGNWVYAVDQYDAIREKFIEGGALVYASALYGLSEVRNMEDDYAILPNPKIFEEQETYGTFVSNGILSAASIPITSADPERGGVILECMSRLSTDTVKTAIYDKLLASKLIRDESSVEMINTYILPNRIYDYVSDIPGGDTMLNVLSSQYRSSKSDYMSAIQKNLKKANTKLEEFLEAMQGE